LAGSKVYAVSCSWLVDGEMPKGNSTPVGEPAAGVIGAEPGVGLASDAVELLMLDGPVAYCAGSDPGRAAAGTGDGSACVEM
jgi:hypothetical protein